MKQILHWETVYIRRKLKKVSRQDDLGLVIYVPLVIFTVKSE